MVRIIRSGQNKQQAEYDQMIFTYIQDQILPECHKKYCPNDRTEDGPLTTDVDHGQHIQTPYRAKWEL